MKVSPITPKPIESAANLWPKATNTPLNFKSILESLGNKTNLGFDNSLQQIDKIQKSLQSSKVLEPKQILEYQIQISQLNLRVELVSKAAESAAALGRKLQNAQ